jgi:hypothetical protein
MRLSNLTKQIIRQDQNCQNFARWQTKKLRKNCDNLCRDKSKKQPELPEFNKKNSKNRSTKWGAKFDKKIGQRNGGSTKWGVDEMSVDEIDYFQ